MAAPVRGDVSAYFWRRAALTANPEKCWLWQHTTISGGYGQISIRYLGKTWYKAHRLAYILFYNIDPADLLVCHKCDTRSCLNPYHLFLGTDGDNARDRCAKGRSALGENNGCSKLKSAQVMQIKEMLRSGVSNGKIAKIFGVSAVTVWQIGAKKAWRHLPEIEVKP